MNIVNKLTFCHLRQNKGRSFITTLGIAASVALITAIFLSIASFFQLYSELEQYSSGDVHAYFFDISSDEYEKIVSDKRIKRAGKEIMPEYNAYQISTNGTYTSRTGCLMAADEILYNQRFTCSYDGEIPKNEHEIAVEKSFIEKNGLDWEIGRTVEISVGNRFAEVDGERQRVTANYFQYNDTFEEHSKEKFKITAILDDNRPTLGFKILRGLSSEEKKINADLMIELKEVNYKSLYEIKQIIKDHNIENYQINTSYLEANYSFDKDSATVTNFLPIIAIILAIVIIASVALIYNSFAMSLSERVRYLGMLASVGATKKQKRGSVYAEGFILGIVGIPLGIVIGIIGIGITLKSVGEKIISTGMINGIENTDISMRVVIPLWCVAAIIIFSAFTIFISSYIPARKASSITPIDAIRQRSEIKIKAKKLKTSKLVRKIFGYEGEIAYKNLKRNGRKSRVIIGSIAISIIMFLSVNYFCQLFIQASNMSAEYPHQVSVGLSYDDKEKFIKNIEDITEIKKYYSTTELFIEYNKSTDDSGKNTFSDDDNIMNSYSNIFNSPRFIGVNVLDDNDFNELCASNSLDYREYYGSGIKGVLLNNVSHKNGGLKVFNDNVIGKTICSTNIPVTNEIEIKGLASYDKDKYYMNLDTHSTITVFIPESVYFKYREEERKNDGGDYDLYYYIGIETDDHEKATEKIQDLMDNSDIKIYSISDYIYAMQNMNTVIFVMEVFIYGFIVLITIITVANIINTISTGIMTRRKEFAMLKSVGTTPAGFRKIVCLESFLYGFKGLVIGYPVSIILSFLMNKALGSDVIPFELNLSVYLIVFAAVFVIVGFSMIYSVSKLKKDSIIETLKDDIC